MSNVDLHREAHRRMSEQSADAAAESFADDAVYTDAARMLTLKGKHEITGWLQEWKTAADARVENATYHAAADDWTICTFDGGGTNDGQFGPFPATGNQAFISFCELVRWRDGKGVEAAIYYDSASLLVKLGHMQPVG